MTTHARTVLREAALTIGAAFGLICLLLAVVAPLFGIRLLVFESGSMAPTVEAGGLAVSRTVSADELSIGDIVSVTPASGERITHRIVGIDRSSGQTLLSLQGDANEVPDPEAYPVTEADRVLLHVNHLGFVVEALASPYAVFLAGGFVACVLLIAFGRRERRANAGGRHRAPVAAAAVVVIALAGAGSLMPSRVAPTSASFTDTAAVATENLTSTTVPAPVVSCGPLSVGSTRLNWTAVPGATGYTLHYGENGSVTQTVGSGTTSKTFSGVATSGVFSVQASVTYGSTTWTSIESNKKSYSVLAVAVGICGDA